MTCQRCARGEEASYRAYTDAMEIWVCETCAAEARSLGIAVTSLILEERDANRFEHSAAVDDSKTQSIRQ
jgi:hypothetical protein